MVPFMNGWMVQMYWYVPAVLKVKEYVPPGAMLPESNDAGPDWLVAVWSTLSLFVHVTVVPLLMLSVPGLNAKFCMVTELLEGGGGLLGPFDPDRRMAAATATTMTTMATATMAINALVFMLVLVG